MLTSPIVGISVYSKYTQIMHCARPRHQYASLCTQIMHCARPRHQYAPLTVS